MNKNLRTAALSTIAGGALTVLGLLLGPAGSASAATVDIHLDATTGSTTLPAKTGTASVPVWGYCQRTDSATPCGGVTAPGGPTLTVTAGDEVTITLHNTLTEATSLYLGGQALVPDTVGAAGGAETSYTFTASRPGTYLYEAGLTKNHQHQVAMGLYGALVVHSATAGEAYDASSTFDTEQVMLLGEIDPALNTSAAPSGFDMRAFAPRYAVVNGQVHPATAPIVASSGQDVLLRWVNAGTFYHSMTVLGADQRIVGLDGNRLANTGVDLARHVVAETFGPGQTADAIVTVPTTVPDRRLAVYDASMTLHNTNAVGAGGMLTFLDVTGAGGTEADTFGPATTNARYVSADGTIAATVSDAATGGGNVTAAEMRLDSPDATSVAMTGAFGAPSVDVTAPFTIPAGQHVVYVRGQDSLGNWGPWSSVLIEGADEQGPTTSALSLTPERANGGLAVVIGATGNDSASGNHAIGAGEWWIGTGAHTPMTVETQGPVASLTGTIPAAAAAALAEGQHLVFVRTQDDQGNWGEPAETFLYADRQGPVPSAVSVSPTPNNGLIPINGSSASVRVVATMTDAVSGDANATTSTVQSPVTRAEAYVDVATAGAPGTGVPMEAADGAFSAVTENVYLDIPLATVKLMSNGPHSIWVRGRDAAGNWGAPVETVLVVDKVGPVIGPLAVTPDPTAGSPQATLSGTVADDDSGITLIEYFIGRDPGVGNGTAISRNTDGTFAETLDTTGLPEGSNRLVVRTRDSLGNGRMRAVTFTVSRPLWFSTLGNTNPPGVTGTADDADIYRWDGAAMSRAVDLSAAPYSVAASEDVDGFSRVDATHFYVSFTTPTNLTGLGTVLARDVAYWNGDHWEAFFRGSVAGLGNTNVDAISVRSGILYFSVSNAVVPPGVAGPGTAWDIYSWNGTAFSRFLTGSSIGLNGNVDGFVYLGADDWAFSVSANIMNVSGLGSIRDEDVIRRTGGTWSVYFDGSAHGMNAGSLDVDAFDLP